MLRPIVDDVVMQQTAVQIVMRWMITSCVSFMQSIRITDLRSVCAMIIREECLSVDILALRVK